MPPDSHKTRREAAQAAREANPATTSEELSGAKLKSERDAKPDDQGDTVTLTAKGGTKVTAPERIADSLKAAGFTS